MFEEERWETWLDIESDEVVDLYVTERSRIVLEGYFGDRPADRRALPLLLESLARWRGRQLCVVNPTLGLGDDGDEWPRETELLTYLHTKAPQGGSGRAER